MVAKKVDLDPVVDDSRVRHCERPRNRAESVVWDDSISTMIAGTSNFQFMDSPQ